MMVQLSTGVSVRHFLYCTLIRLNLVHFPALVAGTSSMFALYISEDLCLRVLSLLHVGVSAETKMQRHSESVDQSRGGFKDLEEMKRDAVPNLPTYNILIDMLCRKGKLDAALEIRDDMERAGKGEFGQAMWRVVYAPHVFNLLSDDPTVDPLKSLASKISFLIEVVIKLGKRLQAFIVRQMKVSEMAMQFTLIYQLTSRLRVFLQSWSTSIQRLLFEYSYTSQN